MQKCKLDGNYMKTPFSLCASNKKILLAAALLGLFCIDFAPAAYAGAFSVTPVQIFMAPKDRATAITVINEGDEEIVLQADIYAWEQSADGKDELTLSEDLFLSPPIIKLAPKSRQVVRLALLSAPVPDRQRTFRMIVREIPEARLPKDSLQLQIAFAFSMPVFITPAGAKAKLDCTVERVAADTVKAICENSGSAFSHPTAFLLTSGTTDKLASQDSGAYILPEIKRSFDLKRLDGNIPAGKANLVVTLSDGTNQSYAVNINE
jgi:fimbrial chaperone protein